MNEAVTKIVRRVLPRFGMEGEAPEILCSKDRHRTIAEARHVAVWVTRKVLGLSFPELGREFGNRDHTTMMNAFRRIESLVAIGDRNPVARAALAALVEVHSDRARVEAVLPSGAVELDLGPGIRSGVASAFELDYAGAVGAAE